MNNLLIDNYLENIGYLKSNINYTNIIEQQAITLFTPISFFNKVIFDLNNNDKNILIYTLNDIIKISANDLKNKEKFTNYLATIKNNNIEFALGIIYSDYSLEELYINLSLLKINTKKINFIINCCLSNIECPTNCFSNVPIINNDLTIITLNKRKNQNNIDIISNINHELQHYFEKYAQLNNNSIERNLEIIFKNINDTITKNKDLINLFVKIGYLDLNNEFLKYDLFSHMFDQKEFYPMLASTSNCLKFYFIDSKKSVLSKIKNIENMLNQNFILSKKFQNLTPNMQSSIFFLYTNKKLSKQRYNICLNELKEQFKENQIHYPLSRQILNNSFDWFKTFIEKITK